MRQKNIISSTPGQIAGRLRVSRAWRAALVGSALISSSAILVHLLGGYIELHFHFFVMLTFLALYQDWVPFGLSILYVAVHHGVVGVLWPTEVYNHPAAVESPLDLGRHPRVFCALGFGPLGVNVALKLEGRNHGSKKIS